MYIQQLGEIFPPPSQNTVGACDQITCLILYYNSSKLVALLKVTDAPIQVPYIFNPAVSFKILNFDFQIGLFVAKMSASFTSYIVQIIYDTNYLTLPENFGYVVVFLGSTIISRLYKFTPFSPPQVTLQVSAGLRFRAKYFCQSALTGRPK